MPDILDTIAQSHKCCATKSSGENGCGILLNGIGKRTIIHGSKFQKEHKFTDKLCDRIILHQDNGCVLTAVELKGGKKTKLLHAIQQIQNGLIVAEGILGSSVISEWLPVLLYNDHWGPQATKVLLEHPVSFRRESKVVIKRDCGTELMAILSG